MLHLQEGHAQKIEGEQSIPGGKEKNDNCRALFKMLCNRMGDVLDALQAGDNSGGWHREHESSYKGDFEEDDEVEMLGRGLETTML